MLNKQTGNMYGFVTHTWNPIRGTCPHACRYCYMKTGLGDWGTLRLDEKTLEDKLKAGRFVFIGSSTDMWADNVKAEWIDAVLLKIKNASDNEYLFQSKNPARFHYFLKLSNSTHFNKIFCTTLESNRDYPAISKAPIIQKRIEAMRNIDTRTMITIEPVMDFDLMEFLGIIDYLKPTQVNIGADSGGNKLPEPSKEKLAEFIDLLKKSHHNVFLKDKLKRILPNGR